MVCLRFSFLFLLQIFFLVNLQRWFFWVIWKIFTFSCSHFHIHFGNISDCTLVCVSFHINAHFHSRMNSHFNMISRVLFRSSTEWVQGKQWTYYDMMRTFHIFTSSLKTIQKCSFHINALFCQSMCLHFHINAHFDVYMINNCSWEVRSWTLSHFLCSFVKISHLPINA